MPKLIAALVFVAVLIAAYFAVVLNWNYSTGERAGWLQKLSYKGFVCKTWEGELALVSLPGSSVEKFLFTVRDDAVANKLQAAMGKRVSLHYEEKVGLPTSCFVKRATSSPACPKPRKSPLAQAWWCPPPPASQPPLRHDERP